MRGHVTLLKCFLRNRWASGDGLDRDRFQSHDNHHVWFRRVYLLCPEIDGFVIFLALFQVK